MKRIFRKVNETELGSVEELLQDVFEPVAPRRGYIKDLNRRLSNYPKPPVLIVSPGLPKVSGRPLTSLIWSAIGVLSGLALLAVGIRVIFILIAGLRAIYQKQI